MNQRNFGFARRGLVQRTFAAFVALALSFPVVLHAGEPPKVGDQAPDFSLKTLEGETVQLSGLTAKSTVALVVLRGWPGYQCPICDRQVQDFIGKAAEFEKAKIKPVFVYPGPAEDLKAHAAEFKSWKGKEWPAEFAYVLDPDYTMVHAYNLRWDARRETAYPSTFLIDGKNVVRYAVISKSHGGRSKAAEVLAEAEKMDDN